MADYALGTDDGSRKRVLLPSADEPVKWFGSPVFLNGVSREESALSTAASGFVARAPRRGAASGSSDLERRQIASRGRHAVDIRECCPFVVAAPRRKFPCPVLPGWGRGHHERCREYNLV